MYSELVISTELARVAKLVDAPGLGPDAGDSVGVRVPPRAPLIYMLRCSQTVCLCRRGGHMQELSDGR